MTFYVDTSVLVAALTREAHTGKALEWLGTPAPGSLVVSDWATTEFSSALSIKLHSGHMTLADRADALAMLSRLCAESLTILPVLAAQFRTAARFADHRELGVRAGDALHLAVCADHGATLVTLDRRLGEAGPALGVKTVLL